MAYERDMGQIVQVRRLDRGFGIDHEINQTLIFRQKTASCFDICTSLTMIWICFCVYVWAYECITNIRDWPPSRPHCSMKIIPKATQSRHRLAKDRCSTDPALLLLGCSIPPSQSASKRRRKTRTVCVNGHHKSCWLWYVHHSAFSIFDKRLDFLFQMLCKAFKQKLAFRKKKN